MWCRGSNKHRAAAFDEGSARQEERAASSRDGKDGPDSYSSSVMENMFRVDARYSRLRVIGKGSFGVVCSALDSMQNKRVAIKKIHPMASHVVDAKRALREIRLMRYLGVHPNIVSLEDLFVCEDYDELYIVMELFDSDLRHVIQSSQQLSDAHHRHFMYQLLNGVKFLHDNGIVHRDLKPGNILVTKNFQLRIADFGLARLRPMERGADPDHEVNCRRRPAMTWKSHHDEVDQPMTRHVVTRWYRPPELMLYPDGLYGYAVDIWSVGCILAELVGRKPLFPGENFIHQLVLIFNILGSPEPCEVSHIRNHKAKKFLRSMRGKIKVPFTDVFQSASPQAVDLLEGLLVFDPAKRLSAHEALEHPYFIHLRKADMSPRLQMPSAFEFDFEGKPLSNLQVKNLILEEVNSFKMEKQYQRTRGFQGCNDGCGGVTRSGRKGGRARWAIGEFRPEHYAQVQDPYYTTAVGRSHRYPPSNDDATPDLEGGLGSPEESQCESNGGVFNHRPWATVRGKAPEEGPGGKDRNYTRGPWYHGAAGRCVGKDRDHTRGRWHHGHPGRYRVPHTVHETQFQGQQQRLLQRQQQPQLMQSQETQHSGKTAASVQDVEERFCMLTFERARLGHPVT